MTVPDQRVAPHTPPPSTLITIAALGVVFGDIGTSPLYALRESFIASDRLAVNVNNVYGVLSLIFWSLVLVVGVKYVVVVMRADNDGEGGILALTAMITPEHAPAVGRTRVMLALGLFGTALLYGDGIITPAISVLSAVEGFGVATPTLDPYVIPVAIAILIGLFAVQQRGTASIGGVFGPIMIVWFSVLALLGVYQVIQYPSILKALNPVYGVRMFSSHPTGSLLALGAIFLVVTGSEALYADMGHFGRVPIRRAWWAVVFPALTINYFGQGALIVSNPLAIENPFYLMSPSWALIPLVILATLATVIASQALISGAFSLTLQAVQLGYLPRVRIRHTSAQAFGQIYIPLVNWLLMVSCLILVLTFKTSSALAAAYGVAVTTTMVITTLLLTRLAQDRWGWSRLRTWSVSGAFLIIDLAFFSANILKLPSGGWLPLAIGAGVYGLIGVWRSGRDRMSAAMGGTPPLERFIASITEHPQMRIPGTAVYLYSDQRSVPPALLANLRHNEVIHETVVVVTVVTANTARVPKARRVTIHDLGDGFVQVVLLYGFMEQIDVPRDLTEITDPDFGFDPTDASYILASRHVLTDREDHPRHRTFAAMHRNAASAAAHFGLPPEDVIEIGMFVDLRETDENDD